MMLMYNIYSIVCLQQKKKKKKTREQTRDQRRKRTWIHYALLPLCRLVVVV